jgi:TP901 family phage tail tape measure protein
VAASPLATAFVLVRANTTGFASELDKELKKSAPAAKASGEAVGSSWAAGAKSKIDAGSKVLAKAGIAAFAGIAVASLDMATKFQEGLTTLVTGAGESEKNLKMVGEGIKSIAVESGTTTDQLVKGMYMIESAGFHGAGGLKVLQAAAEGAKTGNADLGTVADAVTTVLKDYRLSAGSATSVTSGLVAVVAAGKTHMEDLASSLSRVLPTAGALHVSFAQVGAAMATMTGEGTSARLAAMGINTAMLALAAPSSKAAGEMDALGMSAANLAKYSADVAAGNTKAAKALLGTGDTSKKVADTLTHQGLIAALKMVADLALKAGPAGSAAYVAALKTMVGGNRGLQVALETTGIHFSTLLDNYTSVAKATDSTSKHVAGFALVQKDFSFQVDVLKSTVEVAGITIGEKLLPPAEKFLGWLEKTHALVPAAAAAIGLVTAALVYQGTMFTITAAKDLISFGKMIAAGAVWAAEQVADTVLVIAAWAGAALGVETASAAITIATGGIVLILAALVIGGYELYKHWGTVWKFIKSAVMDTWDWIKGHWPLLLGILTGPIGLAALYIYDHWKTIYKTVSDAVHDVITFVYDHWKLLLAIITGPLGLIIDAISTHWAWVKKIFREGIAAVIGFFKPAATWLVRYGGDILKGLWNGITGVAAWLYGNIRRQIVQTIAFYAPAVKWLVRYGGDFLRGLWNGIAAVAGWLYARVTAVITATIRPYLQAGTWLYSHGKDMITGLFNGMWALAQDAGSWAAKIGGKIVAAVKGFFGIHSPSTVFAAIGGHLMSGLLQGMIGGSGGLIGKVFGSMPEALMHLAEKGLISLLNLPGKALSALGGLGSKLGSFFGGLFGGGGSGVQRWAGDVRAALSMLNLPQSDLGFVLNQMQSESGGNPNAQNNWDINAQMGTPSQGLMQVIRPTFEYWRAHFLPDNPFNPMANIYAALNYAKHGKGFGTGPGQIGSMHGYAAGGLITEPIFGIGRSGQRYSFGERGPERVTPGTGRGGGDTHIYNFPHYIGSRNELVKALDDLRRQGRLPRG